MLIVLGNGGYVEFYHPLNDTWYSLIYSSEHVKCVLNDSYVFRVKIENLAYLEDEWISVEESLPENDEHVIVSSWSHSENYGLVKACYKNNDWFIDVDSVETFGDGCIEIGFNITHWQPLPKPPKE